jgi:hypothetical protein
LKFESLAGRRTIACRVGLASRAGPPEILVHQVNFHWRIDDGAMVFEMADNALGTYYRMLCGAAAPTITNARATRARELLPLHEWVHVGVQLGILPFNSGPPPVPGSFLDGNFFVNGRFIQATIQDGGLLPEDLPDPSGVISSWIAVYGQSDPGTTAPWTSPRMVPFTWGLGGRISGFEAEMLESQQEFIGNKPILTDVQEPEP